MAPLEQKFKILLCGKKETIAPIVERTVQMNELHILYTSSENFLISRAMFNSPHLVLINLEKGGFEAFDAVKSFCAEFPSVPVLVISAGAQHQEIIGYIKVGAAGFFVLPQDAKVFEDALTASVDRWRSNEQQKRFTSLQQDTYDFGNIVGKSDSLIATLKRARTVIQNPAITVLIRGETGTGKELLARAVHYNSANNNFPFVDIACSALPETLLESELFGFEKGAFTDARDRKIGLFELAGNGTIFLDEIGDISAATQSKLLKVIETRTMRRLGGLKDIPVKARIIAATSVDLEEKVRSGVFRKDLYHRLKVVPLELPPLRKRMDDLPLLIDTFIAKCNEMYMKNIRGITPRALQFLYQYDWPGNIRELHHCIERSVLLEESPLVTEAHFDLFENQEVPGRAATGSVPGNGKEIVISLELHEATMENVQTKFLEQVLLVVNGNKSKAAQILGISRPRIDRILSKT